MSTQKNSKPMGKSGQGDTPATLKTYLAPGLMEFRLVLHVGEAWIPVNFKGGRLGGYGDYQAIFSTDDPILQYAIEQSPEYNSRRIIGCKRN